VSEPVLSVRDLRVAFPTRRRTLVAVDGVSFDIAPGEVLGVVGESGAGKSLTGAAIIGLLEPPGRIVGGQVRLRGQRIDDLPPEEARKMRGKRIGMVFQDPLTSLNPLYRVGDQIVETIRTHTRVGDGEARERAIMLLQEAGIQGARARINSYPHEFSGGMRQRVVLALALCAEPDLLIADEPTTALDVTVQAQILRLLLRLRDENGLAIILITHDLGVIASTCDSVAVMYAGRIMERAPKPELLRRPLHPYTLGLIRSRPHAAQRGSELPSIEGQMPPMSELPPGCRFHPRCPYARPACRTGDINLASAAPNHQTACIRWREIAELR
jgi:peptide/nickel transport system ATP-binding protein